MANPEVSYKIIALDEARGQMTVKFYNADVPDGIKVPVDLEVQGGAVLVREGQALADYIMGFCPFAEFARRPVLRDSAADYSALRALVEPEPASQLPGQIESDTVPGAVTEL